jgi:hypothetical protein
MRGEIDGTNGFLRRMAGLFWFFGNAKLKSRS